MSNILFSMKPLTTEALLELNRRNNSIVIINGCTICPAPEKEVKYVAYCNHDEVMETAYGSSHYMFNWFCSEECFNLWVLSEYDKEVSRIS